jgi:hypothetical protein
MRWMREGMRWALMTGRQAFQVGDVYRFWGGSRSRLSAAAPD